MSDISKISIEGITLNIKDASARNSIEKIDKKVTEIGNSTLINVVTDIPTQTKDDNIYNVINSDESLSYDMPVSYHDNLLKANNKFVEELNQNKLTVGVFNIDNENVPYRLGLKGVKKLTKLQNIFNKLGCGILGLNEVLQSDWYSVNEFLTTEFLPYYYYSVNTKNLVPNMNEGNAILSHIQPQITTGAIFSNKYGAERQGYCKCVYTFNGKVISVYCTHLCYNNDTTLKNQIAELYNVVSNDTSPYKIIMGDFNFDLSNSASYLGSFLSAGYKLTNGGKYKTYNDSRNLGIDEIMVSSNITIASSGVGNAEFIEHLSDHFPLWSTLIFN